MQPVLEHRSQIICAVSLLGFGQGPSLDQYDCADEDYAPRSPRDELYVYMTERRMFDCNFQAQPTETSLYDRKLSWEDEVVNCTFEDFHVQCAGPNIALREGSCHRIHADLEEDLFSSPPTSTLRTYCTL